MFALVLLGLSLAHDQVPALPLPTDPRYPNTENHNLLSPHDIYGVSMLSAPPESSSHTMIAGTSSSLPVESYTQFGLEDNYSDSTSLPCGPAESATWNVVAAQGHITTTHEASFSRERKVQRGKEKGKARVKMTDKIKKKEQVIARKREQDKARKRFDRGNDNQDYEKICDLLNIKLKPKNKLAHRSECLYIYPCRGS